MKKKFLILAFSLVFLFGLSSLVYAGAIDDFRQFGLQPKCESAAAPEPCNFCHFGDLLIRVSNLLVLVSFPIITGVIIWGALLFLTSGGSPQRIKKGRANIKAAIIGLLIVLLSYTIVNSLLHILATGTLGPPWLQLQC